MKAVTRAPPQHAVLRREPAREQPPHRAIGLHLLRRLARKRFPPAVSAARKVPFHLPLQHYLNDPKLWALIEDNLNEVRVRRRGIVRPEYVRRLKEESRRGDFLLSKKLMALVVLEVWHRIFVDGEAL